MSELRKANTDYPYFATLTVAGWIDIFTRQRYCELILENWRYCIKEKGLLIYAYVIMPSHIHLVARQNEGHLDTLLRDFKSYTAKEIIKLIKQEKGESRKEWLLHMFKYFAKYQIQNAEYMFWQKTSYPIKLNYPKIIDQKIDYIHNNPVEAGYVSEPEAWLYSSACPYRLLQVEPV
jgi:putative transposase